MFAFVMGLATLGPEASFRAVCIEERAAGSDEGERTFLRIRQDRCCGRSGRAAPLAKREDS